MALTEGRTQDRPRLGDFFVLIFPTYSDTDDIFRLASFLTPISYARLAVYLQDYGLVAGGSFGPIAEDVAPVAACRVHRRSARGGRHGMCRHR